MAKPIKIVLAAVGVLLLIAVSTLLAAAAFFDPNDYRGKITESVKQQTGRTLSLGDLQLGVFPWLTVRVTDVSFSNAPGFGDTPMAQVKEAAVGVRLLPLLLRREVKVSTITLEGLRLDLAKDASGRSNWDDLVKPGEEAADEKPADGESPRINRIDIAGLTLRDAFVGYRDDQARQVYRLEQVNLETGALQPGEPMDIEASMSAFADARKISADLVFSATVLADRVAQKATLDALKLDVKAKGESLAAHGNLVANVAADLQSKVYTVDGLTLDFEAALKDLTAQGRLGGKVLADLGRQTANVEGLKLNFSANTPGLEAKGTLAGQVSAALDQQRYQIAGMSLNADASGTSIPGGKQSVQLTGNAMYDATHGAMRFADGKIAAAGLDITTSISGEGLGGDAPRLSGPISVASFSPRALLKTLGQSDIQTRDPEALSRVALSTRYSGTFKSARFEDLQLRLDDSSLAGTLAVRDFATQALDFALKLDRIDADRYLAPAPAKSSAAAASKTARSDLNATVIPLDALETLNASGTLDIGALKIKGATLNNVQLKVDGPKGAQKLIQLDAGAYGGKIATRTRLVPGAKPTYALNTTLSTLQLAPLLQNFAGKDYVSGLGNIKLDLNSGGKTVGDARRALNGDVSLSFENGAIKGFNLGQILRQAQAMLKGTTLSQTEPSQTDFTTITFAAQIADGILKSDQLSAQSPLFRLAGRGEIDLVNETLDYLASPTIVARGKGQGDTGLAELAGLTIPIKLTGSLFAPKYKLDLSTALQQKAADELRGKVAEKLLGKEASGEPVSDAQLREKANEKLNKEIGRGLEKLFGRKKETAPTEPPPAPAEPPKTDPAPAEPAPAP